MTLYQKHDDGSYSPLPAEAETAARADSASLIAHGTIRGIAGAMDYLMTAAERDALLAHWAANDPAIVVPPTIRRRQARQALLKAGLFDAFERAVKAAGTEARIWYEDSDPWHRDHPMVASLGAGLWLSSGQIDDLFKAAAEL